MARVEGEEGVRGGRRRRRRDRDRSRFDSPL
jgi:hypothetical protein